MNTLMYRHRFYVFLSLFLLTLIPAIVPVYAQGTPSIASTVPADNATDVRVDASIAATLNLPNVGFGVDDTTLTSDNVFLYKTADGPGNKVPTVNNTTGGFDAIVMTPTTLLETNTEYTVQYTAGVEDQSGQSFTPYQFTFTTGTDGLPQPSDIQFSQEELEITKGLGKFSSVDISPDGRLFGLSLMGMLHIWDIDADGSLSNPQAHQLGAPRLTIGLVFADDYTSSNPSVWVTHNQLTFNGADHFTGGLSKFTFDGSGFTETPYILGLPRSRKDHLANSLEYGPDGALYMTQGSISAMGDRDNAWGRQPETLLSAAVLRIDLNLLEAYQTTNGGPLDVTTGEPTNNDLTDDQNYGFGDPQLSTTNNDLSDPNKFYNPQLGDNSPVTVFASGIRNAYDLTWHTNGQLYVPTNGSAGGGAAPGTPDPLPAACDARLDAAFNGSYNTEVPAITNIPTRNDFLFRAEENGYYGHPNPTRCEWVLNGGNPSSGTDIGEVETYDVGVQPDRNWRGFAYNFLNNKSPNGVIEYRSNVFNGQLRGQLLVVRFSGGNDVIALRPDATLDIPESNATTGIPGFTGLNNPLDIIEDTRNGNLYVSEFGDRSGNGGPGWITLLKPIDVSGEPRVEAAEELIFSGSSTTDSQDIVITNTGTAPLITSGISLTGINSTNFEITSGNPGTPTLQPNESLVVSVRFNPPAEGVFSAGLRIISNDPVNPVYTVALQGLGTDGEGGGNEPSLQYVLDTYGLGITVGDDNLATNVIHSDSTLQKNVLGPDEIVQPVFERAGAGPVSVTPLAAYGPADGGVTTIVGWYNPTDAATRNDLFTVPGTDSQTLDPAFTGTTSFTPPLDQSFGFYSVWPFFGNRVVYSEDRLNASWDDDLHHVRVYPYKQSNGTTVPNSYIVATEEHVNGWDYNDIVLLVENVQPADLLGGQLRTENRDWQFPNNVVEVGRSHWDQYLTFQRHQTNDQNPYVHDESTLRIHNDSTIAGDNLFITGFNFRDNVNDGPGANTPTEFILINGEDSSVSSASPIELAPGESYDLDIRFVYSRNRSANNEQRIAFLDILSSDPNQPTKQITLSGGWQERAEQGNEPNVQEIAEYFGFSTVIVGPGEQLNNRGLIETIGEEVLSPFWQRVDDNAPVYVRQLAAYHSCCNNSAAVFLQPNINSGNTNQIFRHNGQDGQTLLPRRGSGLGQGTITPPNDTFGFKIDPEWSDPNRNRKGPDICSNDPSTPPLEECGHHVRFWPVRGVDGVLMPNTFLMVMDYSGINYDFNDNVYLVSNITPADDEFDLQLAGVESEDPVDVSNTLTYTYTIFNDSFTGTPDVNFELTNLSGLTLTSLNSNQGTCSGNTCNIGSMIAEGQVTVTAEFSLTQLGSVSVDAQVSAPGETDTTQNATTLVTTVQSGTPATLTVIKSADPESSQAFTFTGTNGIGSFEITDDGTGTANDFSASVNFQAAGASSTPGGFIADNGNAYGDRGNGFTYGWRNVNDGQPFDGTVNARNRDGDANITPQNTLMHLRYNECCSDGNNGTQTPLYWEIEVPNGEYDVTVALGDSNSDSTPETIHAVTAEGIVIADGSLTPSGGGSVPGHSSEYPAARVTVLDGALTIDQADNGFNTKIQYITVEGVSTLNNRESFTLVAGQYDITETLPAGWSLDSVTCEGGSTTNITNGVQVNLVAGDDVTCTFANSQTGTDTAPIAVPDSAQASAGAPVQFSVTANDTPSAGRTIDNNSVDLNTATTEIDTQFVLVNEGTFSYDPATDTMTFTPEIGFTGTVTIQYIVEDDANERSNVADISVEVLPSTACSPISTLPCNQLVVDYTTSGYCAALDGSSGLSGTGFTMVQEPSFTTFNADPLPVPQVPGYNPNLITVTGGQLQLQSTQGIAYRNPSSQNNGDSSSDTNSQINTLGVGLDVSEAFVVSTVINGPDFASGDNNSQQAGLWFGTDEDNFVKFVVVQNGGNPSRIELRVERNSDTGNSASDVIQIDGPNLSGSVVELQMIVDPVADTVSGAWIVDGGAPQTTTALSIPASFTSGVNVGGETMTFAGVFNTSRRSTTSFTTNFDEFCVFPDRNIAPQALADSATINEGTPSVEIDILANDTDIDGTLVVEDVDLEPDISADIAQTVTDDDGNVWSYEPTTGLLTFTPAVGFTGEATIQYSVDDDDDAFSNFATVTVRVNAGPVTVDDAATTEAGTAAVLAILDNDSDPDGLEPITVDIDDATSGTQTTLNTANVGEWVYNGGNLLFTPVADFTGDATLTYTLEDSLGARSAPATVTVSVTEADSGPLHLRVNIGGPQLDAADSSTPVWIADTNSNPFEFRSGGAGTYDGDAGSAHPGAIDMSDSSIPPYAPADMFNTERYQINGTIDFNIPVESGKTYEVRLYFAELFGNVDVADQRVMIASVEGTTPQSFTDIDQIQIAGPKGAFMRATQVTMTDAELNIVLSTTVENPALKGLEVFEVTSPNTAPTAVADAGTATSGVQMTVDIADNDSDTDGTLDLDSVELGGVANQTTVTNADGVWNYAGSGILEFTPDAGFTGDATVTYTIADNLGARSDSATVTVTVSPPVVDGCSPISPLGCDEIEVNVSTGFCLAFDGTEGNIANTGFTMVQEPSFTTFNADPLPDPDVPGYNPALISVTGDQLVMTSTKGIAYVEPGTSSDTNTQINTLGVGFDLTGSYVIRTTIVGQDFSPGGNQFQQAGLWFGLDEDNFVKLALSKQGNNTADVEIRVEENAVSENNDSFSLRSAEFGNVSSSTIELILEVNPTDQTLTGTYTVNGGAPQSVGTLAMPASFASGVSLPDSSDTSSFAGVFNTQRRADEANTIDTNYDEFCIEPATVPTPPEALADSSSTDNATPVTFSITANDSDDDGLDLTSVELDGVASQTSLSTAQGDWSYDTSTGEMTFTPATDFVGDATVDYTIADVLGARSTPATVTVSVTEANPACSPFSTLPCDQLVTNLTSEVCYSFDGTDGGLLLQDSSSIGFTAVAPNSNQLADQPAAVFTEAPSYAPGLVSLGGGNMTVTATQGIQWKANSGTNSTTDSNSLVNGFGTGLDLSAPVTIETTVVSPQFDGSGNAEQAGLWLWVSEDQYIKFVVFNEGGANDGRIQLQVEDWTNPTGDNPYEFNTATIENMNTLNFTLRLVTDAASGTVTGSYSTDGGTTFTEVGTLGLNAASNDVVPAPLFNGVLLTDGETTTSFAGVFTSKRRETGDVSFSFSDFCMTPGTTAPTTYTVSVDPVPVNGTVLPDATTVNAGESVSFTVTPDAGFETTAVSVTDSDSNTAVAFTDDGGGSYTVPAVSSNLALSATFEPLPTYTVNAQATGPGGVSPDGETTYTQGDDAAFSFTPDAGAQVVTVIVDGVDQGVLSSPYVFSDIAADHTLEVVFNIPPVALADEFTTDEGVPVNGNLISNDTDTDDLNAVAETVTTAEGISVTINGDGSFTYDPGTTFNGLPQGGSDTDSFTYQVTDGTAIVTGNVEITINGLNDAPQLVDDSDSTDEATPITVNVLTNDSDPNSNGLTVTGVDTAGVTRGDVTFDASSVTFDPNGEFEDLGVTDSEVQTFTYTVSDGLDNGTGTATVEITINGLNDEPQLVDDTPNTTESTAIAVDVLGNDSDVDGDDLTVISVGTGSTTGSVTITNSGADVQYDPNGQFNQLPDGQEATDTFTYTVSDGTSNTQTATVTVTIAGENAVPVAQADTAETDEDNGVSIDVLTNDSDTDTGDTLSIVDVVMDATGPSGTATVNGASVDYNPNGQFDNLAVGESDTDTFTYAAQDNNGDASDPVTVTVTINGVNDLPDAVDDDEIGVTKGNSVVISVLSNDSDPDDSDTLTITSFTDPAKGSVTNNNDGTLTFNTNGDFASLGGSQTEDVTFTYTISDGNTGEDTATVTVSVAGSNDLPLANDDEGDTNEDSSTNIDVLSNDTDINGDDLSVSRVEGVSTGVSVTINPDGTLNYDPNGQFNNLPGGGSVVDTFTYYVQDALNAESASPATVEVTINGVNDAPIAEADSATFGQNDSASTTNLLTNDSDPDDGDTPSFVSVDTNERLTDNGGGNVSYDPGQAFISLDSGESDTDEFQYTIQDNSGTQATGTFTVTINGLNDAPLAEDDEYTVAVAASISRDAAQGVLANDSDPDTSDADDLSATLSSTTGDQGGTLTLLPDGSFTYEPPAAFLNLDSGESETETFTYTVDDGDASSELATISITVDGSNQAPITQADNGETDEDNTVEIDVLDNDSDPNENDDLSIQSVQQTSANGATITIGENGIVTYDPTGSDTIQAYAQGATETDTFTYTVTDGDSEVTETVTVTVTGVDDLAVAENDTNNTSNQLALSVAAPGVLENDSDIDGGTLEVTDADTTSAEGATVTVNVDGSYEYDPTESTSLSNLNDNQIVQDTFTYTITGGDTATVTIAVRGDSVTAPIAVNDTETGVAAAQTVSINVLSNDTFGDNPQISFGSLPDAGIATIQDDNTVQFIAPDTITTNNTTFTYIVTDNSGLQSDPATVTVVFNQSGPSFEMVISPMSQEVPQDLDAEFTITVFNNGSVDLNDISFNFADLFTSCDMDMNASISLVVGESRDIECMVEAVQANLTFTVVAIANQGAEGVAVPRAQFRTIGLSAAPAQQEPPQEITRQLEVNVIVTENFPPTARNDNSTAQTGNPIAINVLDNDTDPENRIDITTVQVTTPPQNGVATVNNGVVNYVSNDGYVGNESLNYEMCDESGNCATAGVTITVSAEPQDNEDNNDSDNNDSDDNDGGNDDDDSTAPVVIVPEEEGTPGNVSVAQLGFQNEDGDLEWFVTVGNDGDTPLQNVVMTETLADGVAVLDVITETGQVQINGQTVTVTFPVLQPGQRQIITIVTSVTGGEMNATSCVIADGTPERCSQGLAVTSLPRTGETPWWRNVLLAVATAFTGMLVMRVVVLPAARQWPKQR